MCFLTLIFSVDCLSACAFLASCLHPEIANGCTADADGRVDGGCGAGSRTEQRAAARKEGDKRSSSHFGSTAARYMNPRATAKPATEPDRMFRARSVPRGMSPQRSRVADYIRVGSPVQRGNSTQVRPCCYNAKLHCYLYSHGQA